MNKKSQVTQERLYSEEKKKERNSTANPKRGSRIVETT
jgi:hypothetical protein